MTRQPFALAVLTCLGVATLALTGAQALPMPSARVLTVPLVALPPATTPVAQDELLSPVRQQITTRRGGPAAGDRPVCPMPVLRSEGMFDLGIVHRPPDEGPVRHTLRLIEPPCRHVDPSSSSSIKR